MLNGYGDIVPQTHAGRIIAIFVGVVVRDPIGPYNYQTFRVQLFRLF